ncbi:MAG: histidine phosphatase family protein [Wenzhouxiangella sp.]|nr:MAG: histidine phosphatase family protein [Wenzhouxiangella sp.]
MKTLYLLRHAKSSWSQPRLADHDRPLAARGLAAAPTIGDYLNSCQPAPQFVLCSTALRTRQTWDLVGRQLDPSPPVTYDRDCYHASADELLGRLRNTAESIDTLLLVGHNPGMADLAECLTGSGSEPDLRRMLVKFPTAALACIRFDTDTWRTVMPGSGVLVSFVRPRDLN